MIHKQEPLRTRATAYDSIFFNKTVGIGGVKGKKTIYYIFLYYSRLMEEKILAESVVNYIPK